MITKHQYSWAAARAVNTIRIKLMIAPNAQPTVEFVIVVHAMFAFKDSSLKIHNVYHVLLDV